MQRRKPTIGTLEFFSEYIDSFIAHATTDWNETKKASITAELNKLNTAKGAFGSLHALGQIEEVSPAKTLEQDETALQAMNPGWHKLAMEHLVDSFGRYGMDCVGSAAEAVMYANALGGRFATQELFYRGEHQYGYELRSKAERKISDKKLGEQGITDEEIDQLRRFQKEVAADPEKYASIGKDEVLADLNHPRWLPVMQHYDDTFGTRLLDISSSIMAGLYFGTVSWAGDINENVDGILYVLLGGNPGMTVRGSYFEEEPEQFDPDYHDVAPKSIEDSFKDWDHQASGNARG